MATPSVLLIVAALFSGRAAPPDLCADVHLDSAGDPVTDQSDVGLARFCAWSGTTAPVWDASVCCNVYGATAACTPPDARGHCDLGLEMYCEHGELLADGSVLCYQPFPSAAPSNLPNDHEDAPQFEGDVLCCEDGDCFEWDVYDYENCLGDFSWCTNGYLNGDGTVDCFD